MKANGRNVCIFLYIYSIFYNSTSLFHKVCEEMIKFVMSIWRKIPPKWRSWRIFAIPWLTLSKACRRSTKLMPEDMDSPFLRQQGISAIWRSSEHVWIKMSSQRVSGNPNWRPCIWFFTVNALIFYKYKFCFKTLCFGTTKAILRLAY